MNDTPKWLWPAAIAAAIGLALWWIFEPDDADATGLAKLKSKLAPQDPDALLGAAICEAGVAYYGGVAAGMAGAPICKQVGEGAKPITAAGKNFIVGAIDRASNGLNVATHLVESSVVAGVHNTGSGIKAVFKQGWEDAKAPGEAIRTVGKDAYAGGKTVVGDAYSDARALAKAPGHVAKKLLGKIGLW